MISAERLRRVAPPEADLGSLLARLHDLRIQASTLRDASDPDMSYLLGEYLAECTPDVGCPTDLGSVADECLSADIRLVDDLIAEHGRDAKVAAVLPG